MKSARSGKTGASKRSRSKSRQQEKVQSSLVDATDALQNLVDADKTDKEGGAKEQENTMIVDKETLNQPEDQSGDFLGYQKEND